MMKVVYKISDFEESKSKGPSTRAELGRQSHAFRHCHAPFIYRVLQLREQMAEHQAVYATDEVYSSVFYCNIC